MSVQSKLDLFFNVKPSTSEVCSPKTSVKRPKRRKIDDNQYVLDVGQKRIGLQHCLECDMAYNIDDIEDRKAHDLRHNKMDKLKVLKISNVQFTAWKQAVKCKKVSDDTTITLFMFTKDCKSSIIKKTEEIINDIVNPNLGLCPDVPLWSETTTVLLFVSSQENGHVINSVAVIESLNEAELLPDHRLFKGKFIGLNRLWINRHASKDSPSQDQTSWTSTWVLDQIRRYFDKKPLPRSRIAFNVDNIQLGIDYFGDNSQRYVGYANE
ncbi:unnamed protein product [Bursaphelenchus okinawaensis]|uniref:N-acetyltransferase ESCO zinc-finger domain-containing protein n=1 Tax=Bursaphelenchus okinawaensis TaxID=465554 RepID=A0A811LBB2_9BILA|nr:unnamed protein product [Bursaphelenchus okinawaensis]CAG9120869.1 unnamed protein product [Bursaphelenchus okinawaensis]